MKKINRVKISVIFIMIIFIFGCAGRQINVGIVDQQSNNSEIDFTRGRQIEAKASGFQLLLLIPIRINSRHVRAYQSIQEQAGLDYITDIKIRESWTYAFVGTVYTTTIKATAYPQK